MTFFMINWSSTYNVMWVTSSKKYPGFRYKPNLLQNLNADWSFRVIYFQACSKITSILITKSIDGPFDKGKGNRITFRNFYVDLFLYLEFIIAKRNVHTV